jgi:hypothetical protein
VGQTPDALTLSTEGQQMTVRASDVQALFRRHYPVGRNALVGGVLAGGVGALAGCEINQRMSEYEDQCAQAALLAGGATALLGLGIGALVGLLGPRWERVHARRVDGPLVLATPAPARTPPPPPQPPPAAAALPPPAEPALAAASPAELRLQLAGARTNDEPDGAVGAGLRVQVLARFDTPEARVGPQGSIHLGPELAVQWMEHLKPERQDPSRPSTSEKPYLLVSPGVLARVAVDLGALSPALLAGFSFHFPVSATLSVGAGLDWTYAQGMLPLALEVRGHALGEARQLTVGLGTRFGL